MELSLSKLHEVSAGANSRIFKYGETGSAVAMKMVRVEAVKQSKHLQNEYSILKGIEHENIIMALKLKKNVSVSIEEQRKQNILVLEWAEGGSLLDKVRERSLKIEESRELFYQTCQAVEFLHCKYFVHRDIKLENVLLARVGNQLTVKLADFGFATNCLNGNRLILYAQYKGTKRGYMAPEIHAVLQEKSEPYDARKSDIFALGVLLFSLVLGTLPFQIARKQNKLYSLIVQEKYDDFWKEHQHSMQRLEAEEGGMAEDFKELFISMVKANPDSRVQIEDVLESPWLEGPRSALRAQ